MELVKVDIRIETVNCSIISYNPLGIEVPEGNFKYEGKDIDEQIRYWDRRENFFAPGRSLGKYKKYIQGPTNKIELPESTEELPVYVNAIIKEETEIELLNPQGSVLYVLRPYPYPGKKILIVRISSLDREKILYVSYAGDALFYVEKREKDAE